MSSKRRIRRRSCEGKVRHENAENAERAMVEACGPRAWLYQVYRCQFCGGYHFGRMDKRRMQAKRAKMERAR